MSHYILYDLAGNDRDVRFGPFCWIAKYALLHKGLDFDTIALGFQPKSDYPDAEYGKLPMLKAGDDLIKGSDEIAAYLDETIEHNRLVDGPEAQERVEAVKAWMGNDLFPSLGPLMFYRVANALSPDDQTYFRQSREERFGTELETLSQTPGLADKAHAMTQKLGAMLDGQPYLNGSTPALADYLALGPFLWQRSITSDAPYKMDAMASAWLERMLDLFDGYGRKAKCAGC